MQHPPVPPETTALARVRDDLGQHAIAQLASVGLVSYAELRDATDAQLQSAMLTDFEVSRLRRSVARHTPRPEHLDHFDRVIGRLGENTAHLLRIAKYTDVEVLRHASDEELARAGLRIDDVKCLRVVMARIPEPLQQGA